VNCSRLIVIAAILPLVASSAKADQVGLLNSSETEPCVFGLNLDVMYGHCPFDDLSLNPFGVPVNLSSLGEAHFETSMSGGPNAPIPFSETIRVASNGLFVEYNGIYLGSTEDILSGNRGMPAFVQPVQLEPSIVNELGLPEDTECLIDSKVKCIANCATPWEQIMLQSMKAINCEVPVDTPAGSQISYTPEWFDPITMTMQSQEVIVTFSNVTTPGKTLIVGTSNTASQMPYGFPFGVPKFVGITTTAEYEGGVEVCLRYGDQDGDGIVDSTTVAEGDLRVLHEEDGVLVDRTILPIDTNQKLACAGITTFSQVVMVEGGDTTTTTIVSSTTTTTLPPTGCPSVPKELCREPVEPFKALLLLGNNSDNTKDKLTWKWVKGEKTDFADFGDPRTTDDYTLCIYETVGGQPSVLLSATAPAGDQCAGLACWKALGTTGYKYKDRELTPNGLDTIILKAGDDGKAKIIVKGKGANLGLLTPLDVELPVTVQLQSGNGQCWGADYFSVGVKKNEADLFKAKAGSPSGAFLDATTCASPLFRQP